MSDDSEVLSATALALWFTANTFPKDSGRWKQWRERAAAIEAVVAERDKLRQALEWIWREMMFGGPTDIDTQDTLVTLGLLIEVPADEQFREDWDADTMFVLAWQAKGDTISAEVEDE